LQNNSNKQNFLVAQHTLEETELATTEAGNCQKLAIG